MSNSNEFHKYATGHMGISSMNFTVTAKTYETDQLGEVVAVRAVGRQSRVSEEPNDCRQGDDDSWFPLTIGSQWTYLRSFDYEDFFYYEYKWHIFPKPTVVDTLTVCVIGDCLIGDERWSVLLDGFRL